VSQRASNRWPRATERLDMNVFSTGYVSSSKNCLVQLGLQLPFPISEISNFMTILHSQNITNPQPNPGHEVRGKPALQEVRVEPKQYRQAQYRYRHKLDFMCCDVGTTFKQGRNLERTSRRILRSRKRNSEHRCIRVRSYTERTSNIEDQALCRTALSRMHNVQFLRRPRAARVSAIVGFQGRTRCIRCTCAIKDG
jgi:hypothetical protein